MKKIFLAILITLLSFAGFAQMGNVTGQRVQANANLLPPLDTILAPFRVGELRTRASGINAYLYVCVSLSADKKWYGIGEYTLPVIPIGYPYISNGAASGDSSIALFVDRTNNRVGIGLSNPTSSLTLDSTRSLTGITLLGSTSPTSNFSRTRLYRTTAGANYDLETSGTGTVGAHIFRASSVSLIEFNANNIIINKSILTGATAGDNTINIGRQSVSPLRFRSFYLGTSFQVGQPANTPIGAKVDIGAGTATANTAPLKFTAGVNLTTPEAGAVEFDGTNYFVTSSTTRYTLAKTLTNTASLDYPSVAVGGTEILTITVTGAADGDVASVGVPIASQTTGLIWQAYVSAADTVTIAVTNTTGAPIEPATATFRATVIKY